MASKEAVPECDLPAAGSVSAPKPSKREVKRLARHRQWLANKPERKRREKEKRREKIARLAAAGEKVVSRKELRAQLVPMRDSKCRVRVVIDCDYAHLMAEAEMKKLCKQLNWCYSANKHSDSPVQLYITSIAGEVRRHMEKYQEGFPHWDAHCSHLHWTEVLAEEDRKESIYLTGDSENPLPSPELIQQHNCHTFVIGGLIDHNRHKGASLEAARVRGVSHASLPLGDHIRMTQRRVLAVPHVFEIMLYAANGSLGSEWSAIFHKVIPARKVEAKKENVTSD